MNFPFRRHGHGDRVERRSQSSGLLEKGAKDLLYLEQFRALQAKFEYKIDMLAYKVVAVTSAVAGEGKTTSAAHLAMCLATSGRKKVLLIDVDIRKCDLAECMNINPSPGLVEFLSGSAGFKDIVSNSKISGLHLIPSGARMHAPVDLLAGEKFRSFLQEMRNQFQVVILDTPPILPVADTLSLKDQVDGFLFLYRVGFTPHDLFRQALEEIGEKKVLGVVLNGVEPRNQKYYKRYYGKYYKPQGRS